MSFMAKRLINKFRSEDYKKSVAHSFLKPNQKINIFRQNESEYKIRPVKKWPSCDDRTNCESDQSDFIFPWRGLYCPDERRSTGNDHQNCNRVS